ARPAECDAAGTGARPAARARHPERTKCSAPDRARLGRGGGASPPAARGAEELRAQARESLRGAGLEPSLAEATPDEGAVASTDYRAASRLVVRSVLIHGAGHAWTGGPGGHPYCESGGVPLTPLCARFLRDAGLFESAPAPSG